MTPGPYRTEDVTMVEEILGMTFEVSVNEDGDVVYALFPAWPAWEDLGVSSP